MQYHSVYLQDARGCVNRDTGTQGCTPMPVQLCSGSFIHVGVHVNLHICVAGRYICYMYEHLQVILQFLCPSQKVKNLPWQLLCPP